VTCSLEIFKQDRVSMHMIDLGEDVTDNGISKPVFGSLAALAENERDRLRECIREVKQAFWEVEGESSQRPNYPHPDQLCLWKIVLVRYSHLSRSDLLGG